MKTTEASAVLKEGMLVSTRLGSSAAWYNNIIIKLDSHHVTLSLIGSYLENTIMPDMHFVVKYTNEFFEYVFEGIVTNINPKYPASVTVHIKKAEELVNTRFFPRYDAYIAASIKPQWDNKTHFSIVNNICLGGMAFVCKHDLDYGEEADVAIYLSEKEVILSKGKVIRKSVKDHLFSYSMQFIDMLEESNNILANYLSSLDENNSLLQNNFHDCIKNNLKKAE